MAEIILSPVMSVVARRILEEILSHSTLESEGWRGEEAKLRLLHECEDIEEYLGEADKKRERSSNEAQKKEIDEWAKDAVNLLNRLLDRIEMFMLPRTEYPVGNIFGALLKLFLEGDRSNAPWWDWELAKLVKEVEKVRKRMPGGEVRKRIPGDEVMPTALDQKPSTSVDPTFVPLEMIDMQNRANQLKELMKQGAERKLIFIVGAGGTGKTTLAARIYDELTAQSDFHCWVVVSKSNGKDVLRSVLSGFYLSISDDYPDEINDMDEEKLAQEIRSYCDPGRNYLLVLDDVEDGKSWECLREALPETGCKGKIIFTTRNKKLPEKIIDKSKAILRLDGLSNVESRKLFRTRVFSYFARFPPEPMMDTVKEMGIENEILEICNRNPVAVSILWRLLSTSEKPPADVPGVLRRKVAEMENIEERILEKCDGNPLSIRTIGGMLKTKQATPEAWNDVLEDLDANLAKCRNAGTEGEATDPFVLSGYADLPWHLKLCFLYCNTFPENSDISRKRLIRLWIAAGHVQEIPGKTLEEAAEHQLEQLIDRDMLQVAKRCPNGGVLSCKVLQLVRRIALDICNRQNFCSFSPAMGGRSSNDEAAPAQQLESRHRRRTTPSHHRVLSVRGDAEEINKALTRSFHLRSLLFFGTGKLRRLFRHGYPYLTPRRSSFKTWPYQLLRVLELQGVQIVFLPEQLRYLALLRYLGLRRTGVQRLPRSVGSLQYLETLDIRETNVVEVSDLHRLQRIRHLHLASSFRDRSVNVPRSLIFMMDLQTLAGVTCTPTLPRELRRLIQLRKLSVSNVVGNSSEQLCASISRMMLLGSLTIKCDRGETFDLSSLSSPSNKAWAPLQHLRALKLGGPMVNLLDLVSSIKSITYLYLWDSQLQKDPMESLQYLPNLVLLSLYNAYDGTHLRCNGGGFQKLKKLSVLSLTKLKKWERIEIGAMPALEKLFVGYCTELKEPPEGLGNIGALRVVQVADMTDGFVEMVRRENRNNHYKVMSIPKYQRA